MTITTPPLCGPTFDDAYALFSPDARQLRTQVVVAGSRPGSLGAVLIKSIEMRQQPFAPWLRQAQTLSNLARDWDSYGAAPISGEAIATARALLTDLSFQPLAAAYVPFHIAPDPTGGIQIEWRRADGSGSLELWIGRDGLMQSLVDRPFGEPRLTERNLSGLSAAVSEIKTFAA